MKRVFAVVAALTFVAGAQAAKAQGTYQGFCDASAGVAVGEQYFLVAGDEYNRPDPFDRGETINRGSFIYLFKRGVARPQKIFRLPRLLRDNANRELDIEGAARTGRRAFWITSHARNKKGKLRPNRYRLFATDLSGNGSNLALEFVGTYRFLVRDMLQPQNWAGGETRHVQRFLQILYDATLLDADLPKRVRKRLAPKRSGLNIEALAVERGTKHLLVGLRNPLVDGRAVVVAVLNGNDLVTGNSRRARFAGPYLLDLGGKGIRGMAYSAQLDAFVIIAGPVAGAGRFDLVVWKGPGSNVVRRLTHLVAHRGSNPESVIALKRAPTLLIVNDEGSRKTGFGDCKHAPLADQSFRIRTY